MKPKTVEGLGLFLYEIFRKSLYLFWHNSLGILELYQFKNMEDQIILDDFRCDCGRLLFKGALLECKLEIKCKKCGAIKTILRSKSVCGRNEYEVDRCDFLLNVDQSGKLLSVNENMANILGYSMDETLGRLLFDFLRPEANLNEMTFLFFAADKRPFRILRNSLKHKKGSAIFFETYFLPRYNGDEFIGYTTANWVIHN
ncbi:MAG: hypothetical protein A3I29_03570 [Candidatus Magasanikbacteria bacterium RIFCSPLOWO2_02_FULL_44_11]|uniref:PAS domain-containing protein n=1 Tax=Candidatus Magasanikbacteria bacterium RIFCSPLOWO2_02_FULL_44_11 TaxID=1798689 RepID=A0A1F6NC96_9BACT|nr:MAG: hypothetical protein A3I29_03570 [Candidatus Magasanikbacteria bacterium RIFCSPLOWO2_02_FULL_44_11]